MPILPPEPFAFPANPFDAPDVRPHGCEWLVLHTKSRAEKALARWLLAASVRFFLPLYKKPPVRPGVERGAITHAPLFPGYLFVWGDADARYHALASNHVAQCLPVPDQGALESDLSAVYRLMTGELPVAPERPLAPGTPVEVIAGPFAGMTGRLIRSGAQTRLFIEVRMINQGVSVELDRSAVRPLTENGRGERARIALLRR
jgi:transcription antitermination factor NusG